MSMFQAPQKPRYLYNSTGDRAECNRRLYTKRLELLQVLATEQGNINSREYDFFEKMLNAKESILRYPEMYSETFDTAFFLEVAQYNICKRFLFTLNRLGPSHNFYTCLWPHHFLTFKGTHYLDSFNLVEYKFEKDKHDFTLYEEALTTEEQLVLLYDRIEELTILQEHPVNRQEQRDFHLPERIEDLKKLRDTIEKYGNPKSELLAKLGTMLEEDWHVTFDENGKVPNISWIDIHKEKVKTIEPHLR